MRILKPLPARDLPGAAFRQRPEGVEADDFDDALADAVEGLAEMLQADAKALARLQAGEAGGEVAPAARREVH